VFWTEVLYTSPGSAPTWSSVDRRPSAGQPWLAIVGESTTLAAAAGTDPARANGAGRHVACYADADLSANLAQLGSLAAPVVAGDKVAGALSQRYGIDGAVLARTGGPVTEPHSTSDKPDKIIVLFRHFVRALLIRPWPRCPTPRPASRSSTGPRSARPSGR
jgi:hypothetical protein